MENDFNLASDDAFKLVSLCLSDMTDAAAKSLGSTGSGVIFIKNEIIIKTALKLANITINYHDIKPPLRISNCKKFAHITYWLLKLYPISYIPVKDVTRIGAAAGLVWAGAKKSGTSTIENKRLSDIEKSNLFKINELAATYMFTVLSANTHYNAGDSTKKIAAFLEKDGSKQMVEITRSLKYHNYSARSMAMYLESLTYEKIL